eukprot:CAMPEP_0185039864 /NCGR_PEP_ID=MMETSP1103-20130426/37219_1 /TAXON_ID=36769 /ORGANISM="Paraphysomonas bandaiensis, Strain Caron Lab Isolate" /LENGTH=409 /DNA_ID=CAMNT_0027578919 /DNA_START=93 /DNA_END=1319 /DNA_ORIENTATION=+
MSRKRRKKEYGGHIRNPRNQTQSDEDTKRKTAEIEAALKAQRARNASSAVPDAETKSTSPVPSIPGMVYDSETDRYYRRKHAPSRPSHPTLVASKKERYPGVTSVSCVEMLRNRAYGGVVYAERNYRVIDQLISHTLRCELLSHLTFPRNKCDLSFHVDHGLALSSGGAIRFHPDRFASRSLVRGHVIQSLRWRASPDPCLAALTHDDQGTPHIYVIPASEDAADRIHPPLNRLLNVPATTVEWVRETELVLLGCQDGLATIQVDLAHPPVCRERSASPVSALSPVVSSGNVCLAGMRNGRVVMTDLRCVPGFSPLCSLPLCVDHVQPLQDGYSVVCRDVAGNISVYDLRAHSRERMTICRATSLSRASLSRSRFWVSSDERILVTSGIGGTHLSPRQDGGLRETVNVW